MNERRKLLGKFIGLSGLTTIGTVGSLSDAHAECACACNRESGCACVGHERCVCIGNTGTRKIEKDTPDGDLNAHPSPLRVGPLEKTSVLRVSPSDSTVFLKGNVALKMDMQDLVGIKKGDSIVIRRIYSGEATKGAVKVVGP